MTSEEILMNEALMAFETTFWTTLIITSIFLGLIPAIIARSKGRSFLGFWIYGSLFGLLAFVHSLVAKPNTDLLDERKLRKGTHRQCPHCMEIVRAQAQACRFCKRSIEDHA